MHLINLRLNLSLSNVQHHCDKITQYPSAQEVFKRCQNVNKDNTFLDLWQDDFLQAMPRVVCCSLRQLGLEPYSQAVFKYGLKARGKPRNVERN